MAVLPLLFWGSVAQAFIWRGRAPARAFLQASVVTGTAVVLITEVLSFFSLLARWPLVLAWSVPAVVALLAGAKGRRARSADAGLPNEEPFRGRPALWLRLVLVLILGLTLLTAWAAAPNNWDSMTYHLGRVCHWEANRSVHPYPTNVERQVWSAPWAEFLVLHFRILSGGSDRCANLVQWLAFAGTLVAVAASVGALGGGRRARLAASLLAATTPVVILQSTSTQNDLAASFWLACFSFFLICFAKAKRPRDLDLLWAGLAFGLAACTKPTAFFFGLPLVAWLLWSTLRSGQTAPVRAALLLAVPVAALNAGQALRNFEVYRSPIGLPAVALHARADFSAAGILSNLSKNAGTELATPSTRWNWLLTRGLASFHKRALHLDLTADRDVLWWFGVRAAYAAHEDFASNPLQMVCGAGALGLALAGGRRWRGHALALLLCAWSGFVLFSLLVNWQPWVTRLHTPFFVLLVPPLAIVFADGLSARGMAFVLVAVSVTAVPLLLFNRSRPLVETPGSPVGSVLSTSRPTQYFANRPELREPYESAVAWLVRRGCRLVALKGTEELWEYPLWQLARLQGADLSFTHVLVENPTGRIAPDVVRGFCVLLAVEQPAGFCPKGRGFEDFREVWRRDPLVIYAPAQSRATSAIMRPDASPSRR